jgi:hypothetical protein
MEKRRDALYLRQKTDWNRLEYMQTDCRKEDSTKKSQSERSVASADDYRGQLNFMSLCGVIISVIAVTK